MTDSPIVYAYPYTRWEDPPARHRYLMEAMSAHTRVIYLNTAHTIKQRITFRRPYIQSINSSLTLIQNAFSFRASRFGKRIGTIASQLDAHLLKRLLAKLCPGGYIYWLSAPIPEMMLGMAHDRLVYDCIDPCFNAAVQREYDENEQKLASKANTVFCTAEILHESMAAINSRSYLLPNACSPDHFINPTSGALPPALQGRPQPIIGCMGTIDWRLDVDTVYHAAQALPKYTFLFIGRINRDQADRIKALQSLPNVIMTGSVSREEGLAYTAATDIGLIPYLGGYMGDAVNSVKMYMYLAAGKPVVTTWLRESVRHAPYVTATKSSSDFVLAIQNAALNNNPVDSSKRVEFARQNTWQDRARDAMQYLSAS